MKENAIGTILLVPNGVSAWNLPPNADTPRRLCLILVEEFMSGVSLT